MASKILLLGGLILLFGTPAFAAEDILSVSILYNHEQNTVQIIGVDKRVGEVSKVSSTNPGIRVALSDGSGLVSETTYPLPLARTEMEILGGESAVFAPPPPESLYSVSLPLTRSIDKEDARITITNGTQVLTEKKLSEVPFETLAVQTSRVKEPALTQSTTTPVTASTWSSLLTYPIILLAAGFIALILIIVIFLIRRRRSAVTETVLVTSLPTNAAEPLVPDSTTDKL